MTVHHYTPPVNDKRHMTRDDFPGWYQITVAQCGGLAAKCMWWNGFEWNWGPNKRRGWKDLEADVRGIVRLTEDA